MSKSSDRVVATLKGVGGFVSAQEVYQLLSRRNERIGLTTVYRALQYLLDAKIVDVLRRDDGEAIYRYCGEPHHHHLVCQSCGRTVEISDNSLEKWATKVADEHGFREITHSAELFGICSAC